LRCRPRCIPISAPKSSPDPLVERVRAALPAGTLRRRLLVGVSGGADSVALLHLLLEAGATDLVVCHLDHGLRGREARADAAFVARLARRRGCAFVGGRVDTAARAAERRASLELAARELRHEFFLACARQHRSYRLVLAHQADDQVETVLFHVLRGTGAAGLAGMKSPARLGRLTVHRPLLGCTRAELREALAARRQAFREDASNLSPAHTRNRLRLTVLPAITQAVGDSFRPAVLRLARIMAAEDAWMESLVPEVGPELDCRDLRAAPLGLRRRIVLRWLRRQGIGEPGFDDVERVLALLDPRSGPAKVNLPRDRHARRRAGKIFLT
jgi:tRNA(Ile)-lysidine synthase